MSKTFRKYHYNSRKTRDLFDARAHERRGAERRNRDKERLKKELEEVALLGLFEQAT